MRTQTRSGYDYDDDDRDYNVQRNNVVRTQGRRTADAAGIPQYKPVVKRASRQKPYVGDQNALLIPARDMVTRSTSRATYSSLPTVRFEEEEEREKGFSVTRLILYLVLGASAVVIIIMGTKLIAGIYTGIYNNIKYQTPRMYQLDTVVGHNQDNLGIKTHFIAQNLNGRIVVIECPGGDCSKSVVYEESGVYDPSVPVELVTKDVNSDGLPDLVVKILEDGSTQYWILLNTGKNFDPKAKITDQMFTIAKGN